MAWSAGLRLACAATTSRPSLAVEAVHDAGPRRVEVGAGDFGAVRQQGIHQRAGGASGAGMHGHSRRLVDDQQVLVLIHDIE